MATSEILGYAFASWPAGTFRFTFVDPSFVSHVTDTFLYNPASDPDVSRTAIQAVIDSSLGAGNATFTWTDTSPENMDFQIAFSGDWGGMSLPDAGSSYSTLDQYTGGSWEKWNLTPIQKGGESSGEVVDIGQESYFAAIPVDAADWSGACRHFFGPLFCKSVPSSATPADFYTLTNWEESPSVPDASGVYVLSELEPNGFPCWVREDGEYGIYVSAWVIEGIFRWIIADMPPYDVQSAGQYWDGGTAYEGIMPNPGLWNGAGSYIGSLVEEAEIETDTYDFYFWDRTVTRRLYLDLSGDAQPWVYRIEENSGETPLYAEYRSASSYSEYTAPDEAGTFTLQEGSTWVDPPESLSFTEMMTGPSGRSVNVRRVSMNLERGYKAGDEYYGEFVSQYHPWGPTEEHVYPTGATAYLNGTVWAAFALSVAPIESAAEGRWAVLGTIPSDIPMYYYYGSVSEPYVVHIVVHLETSDMANEARRTEYKVLDSFIVESARLGDSDGPGDAAFDDAVAPAVWAYATRTVTAISLVPEAWTSATATAVWENSTRTLTEFAFEVTTSDHAAIAGIASDLADVSSALEDIASVVLDEESAVDGKTLRETLQAVASTVAGISSGAEDGDHAEVFIGLDKATARVAGDVDESGNRTDIEYS